MLSDATKMSRKSHKRNKNDIGLKVERSRVSARECRARKKLRYQYLEDLVRFKERSIFKVKKEVDAWRKLCQEYDNGSVSDCLLKILGMDQKSTFKPSDSSTTRNKYQLPSIIEAHDQSRSKLFSLLTGSVPEARNPVSCRTTTTLHDQTDKIKHEQMDVQEDTAHNNEISNSVTIKEDSGFSERMMHDDGESNTAIVDWILSNESMLENGQNITNTTPNSVESLSIDSSPVSFTGESSGNHGNGKTLQDYLDYLMDLSDLNLRTEDGSHITDDFHLITQSSEIATNAPTGIYNGKFFLCRNPSSGDKNCPIKNSFQEHNIHVDANGSREPVYNDSRAPVYPVIAIGTNRINRSTSMRDSIPVDRYNMHDRIRSKSEDLSSQDDKTQDKYPFLSFLLTTEEA